MFGSQKPQGRRQNRGLAGILVTLVASLLFCNGIAASDLDGDIVELKEEAGRHSVSIRSLERNQLRPLGTRLAVFLTLDSGSGLELDSIDLFIDNRSVASRLYSPRERSGLKEGAIPPLYVGHLKNGNHELKAVLTGRSADGDFVRREATHPFSKRSTDLSLQLTLTANAPEFEPRVAVTEKEAPEGHLPQGPAAMTGAARETVVPPAETHRKGRYDLAESHRRAGNLQKTGEVLAAMPEGYWAAAGYLNLASDFARKDLDPSRALVALRVAMAMAKSGDDNERSRHLHDQALLRAGYLAYRNGEFDKAVGFLESVSLDSPGTPRALYLHGLALTERGNHRAAMQSWHRARKFPLAYPGVAEAWIGMGRGYDLAGYLGQAGEAYLAANAAYESERVVLRTLTEQVRNEGAYRALVANARASDLEWFLADSRSMQQPRVAYLLEFLTQPAAQRAVGRVAALAALDERLTTHAHDLRVFASALRSAPSSVPESAIEEVARLRQSNDRYFDRLAGLRHTAEGELDKLVLEYLDHQDQRMVFALNKTEQQIAHLYEYLALESLGGQGQ